MAGIAWHSRYSLIDMARTTIKLSAGAWFGCAFVLMSLMSTMLAAADKWQTVFSWWAATLLMLPPLLLAIQSRFLTFRVLVTIVFVTQFITLPVFLLNPDDFWLGDIKPFNFTSSEVMLIFSRVTTFLICTSLSIALFSSVSFDLFKDSLPKRFRAITCHRTVPAVFNISKRSRYFFGLILITVFVISLLNIWMFQNGISIVGVEPPRLPFKLSGIFHYFTKYVVPLMLGYLYYHSPRNLTTALLLLAYGLLLGLTSVSRSALVLVLLPILALAWIDRRKWIFGIIGGGLLISYSLISRARDLVYFVSDGVSSAVTEGGIFTIVNALMQRMELDTSAPISVLVAILNRIEGFENLVLSVSYSPNAVDGGAFGFILRMIWRPLAAIDLDQHHLQWQGAILPEGFVNGGALLSNMIIASNDNFLWILVASIITGLLLFVLECSVRRVARRSRLPSSIEVFIITVMTIIFFIEGGGSVTFVVPFVLLTFLAWMPSVSLIPSSPLRGYGSGVTQEERA